jgi:hypothetical protein
VDVPYVARNVHSNNPALRNPQLAKMLFESARRPAMWLYVGRDLLSSANIIFRQEGPVATRYANEFQRFSASELTPQQLQEFREHFPPPIFDGLHLLVGLAIENFLKGMIIAKERVQFDEHDLELPKRLKTHDLHKLHDLATPTATIASHLLHGLTYMTEWRARYPLPLSVDKFWPISEDGTPKPSSFTWPGSYDEIFRYCDQIESELVALIGEAARSR